MSACASAAHSDPPPPTLVGNWLYTAGQGGLGATFTADGKYSLAGLVLVSPHAAQAELETGTYVSDATTIMLTPQRSSCPGPHPMEVDHYQFNNGLLVISSSAGIVSMQPNTATIDQAFAIQTGCADDKGNFTAHPIADVAK